MPVWPIVRVAARLCCLVERKNHSMSHPGTVTVALICVVTSLTRPACPPFRTQLSQQCTTITSTFYQYTPRCFPSTSYSSPNIYISIYIHIHTKPSWSYGETPGFRRGTFSAGLYELNAKKKSTNVVIADKYIT